MRSGEEKIGQVTVLRLDHPIDRDHAPELDEWVRDKLSGGERYLVLHCGKVLFFDSVGLETLLAATRATASQGARLALAHLNTDCATILRVTRLERAIEHFAGIEEAIRQFRGRSP